MLSDREEEATAGEGGAGGGEAVKEVVATHSKAEMENQSPTFVSQIALGKLEAALEEELGMLIAKQFEKDLRENVDGSVVEGGGVPVCQELVKGRGSLPGSPRKWEGSGTVSTTRSFTNCDRRGGSFSGSISSREIFR